ncbi:MAG: tRNA (guanosine(37)-N1)-methyltransferase TrmD [Chitinophagales bacterium]
MIIKVLTLFPEMFDSPLQASLIGKAINRGIIKIEVINLRDYALDKHQQADDSPFGGGAGMVMKADVVIRALRAAKSGMEGIHSIYLGPSGGQFKQETALRLAKENSLLLLCGHYEGVDERAMTEVDETISIGDYILTGGELPALIVIDAISRLVPGVLGSEESICEESFSNGLLEYPQYTRPREVDGMEVPEILLSGNHEQIRRWRRKESLRRTLKGRPDLLMEREFDLEEKSLLAELLAEGKDSNET